MFIYGVIRTCFLGVIRLFVVLGGLMALGVFLSLPKDSEIDGPLILKVRASDMRTMGETMSNMQKLCAQREYTNSTNVLAEYGPVPSEKRNVPESYNLMNLRAEVGVIGQERAAGGEVASDCFSADHIISVEHVVLARQTSPIVRFSSATGEQ